jgi:hypothetical protein
MIDTDNVTRDAILNLLSNEELASVHTPDTATCLNVGDEFLDLEHVELGVRRASGTAAPAGYVLPRSAVSDNTWLLVVSTLDSLPSETA